MATRSQSPRALDEYELKAVIGQQLMHARSYLSAEVASDRQANLRYYLNRPFGNEVEGRSQVISTDVQDTIEALMPDLIEMFCATGNIWKFLPEGPEDVELVEQINDYIFDVVWNKDNDSFKLTHDAIKDALLEKTGIFKIWWDDTKPEKVEVLRQVSMVDVLRYESMPDVEILEAEETSEDGFGFWNIKIKRTQQTGRCRVEVIPSEEFLISTRARELDETTSFCAHRRYTTRSELVEMGYDEEYVWTLPTIEGNNNANLDRSRVRHARFSEDRSALTDYGQQFESEREIEIYECYPLVDIKGEGISKRHLVRAAGFDAANLMPGDPEKTEGKLLPDLETGEYAVEIDCHPFVDLQCIRQPHRFFGRAVADLVRDVQMIKSTIQRQTLDNIYQINNQRAAVSNKVDLDDYLNNDVGAAIPVNDVSAANHVVPVPPQPISQITEPLLRYWDEVLQNRTGTTQGTDPIDPKSFHETFGGANLMLGQLMKRLLFLARTMAETGFKRVGKKILRTVVMNQDAARVVRLRNKWVPVDPRRWNAELDVEVAVGLGHGTKETRFAGAMQLATVQERVVAELQGGSLAGPWVTPNEIDNTLDTICSSMSMSRDLYFKDLTSEDAQKLMMPKPPQPSDLEKMAEMQRQIEIGQAQMRLMAERMDNQVDILKLREDARQHNDEMGVKMAQIQAETGVKREQLLLTAREGERQAVKDALDGGDASVAESYMSQVDRLQDSVLALTERVQQLADAATRPRRLIRGPDGRATGSEVVTDGSL